MEIGFINSGWEVKGFIKTLSPHVHTHSWLLGFTRAADAEAVDRLEAVNTS